MYTCVFTALKEDWFTRVLKYMDSNPETLEGENTLFQPANMFSMQCNSQLWVKRQITSFFCFAFYDRADDQAIPSVGGRHDSVSEWNKFITHSIYLESF